MYNNGQATSSQEELVGRQRSGFSLEQPFYNDPAIFALDMERIYGRHWLYAGHVNRIPQLGDYFLYNLGCESIIILRAEESEVHALFNVCRHRGSRICLSDAGAVKKLVCPYHAWIYGLDGRLVAARQMPADFDKGAYGLARGHIQVVEGLIFICLAEEPPEFATFTEDFVHYFGPHDLSQAKIAHHENYVIQANWKLVAENFWECYHCTPTHPEYCSVMSFVHALDSPRLAEEHAGFVATWRQQAQGLGHHTGIIERRSASELYFVGRSSIGPGMYTQSEGGRPVAPLMGDFKQYDGGITRAMRSPYMWFVALNDHAMLARITPVGPQQTAVELTWLVHPDAVEGVDYDPLAVSWLLRITVEQDIPLCEHNQAGVNSRRYQPGPYAKTEDGPRDFVDWYLSALLNPGRE